MKRRLISFLLVIAAAGLTFHAMQQNAVVPTGPLATIPGRAASSGRDATPSPIEPRRVRVVSPASAVSSGLPVTRAATSEQKKKALSAYLQLPLDFEANQGQAPKDVDFLAHGPGYALGLSPGLATLSLQRREKRTQPLLTPVSLPGVLPETVHSESLQLRLVGASSAARVSGEGPRGSYSNYFIGNDPARWERRVPHFSRVKMAGVYPGVDLVFYGNPQQLEYDFLVAPGADPRAIRLHVGGSRRVYLDRSGNAILRTAAGDVQLKHPDIYQLADGSRKPVAGRFRLQSRNQLGIEVGVYDRSKPLIIDPVLVYAASLSGTNGNQTSEITSLELDASGNIYVTGSTCSTDFPSTAGPFQDNHINLAAKTCLNSFVSKFDPTLSTLIFSDFIGGTNVNAAWYLAVDASNNIYVVGSTNSSDFPLVNNLGKTTAPAPCLISKTSAFACPDAYVYKLSPDGTQLIFSELLGGNQVTSGNVLQLDPVTNDLVVMGITNSSDFQPAPTALLKTFPGGTCSQGIPCFQTYLVGLDSTTGALRYGTFLGGPGNNFAVGMELDSLGGIYLSGSTQLPFSATLGPVTQTYAPSGGASAAGTDIFVMKLDRSALNALSVGYITVIQGESDDGGTALAVDASNNVFVTGVTNSQHLPVTVGAFQSTNLDVNGSDCKWALALKPFVPDACGTAWVGKLGPAGTLSWLTYLGGTGPDLGEAIGIDSNNNIWLGGITSSSNFPFSADAYVALNSSGIVSTTPFLAEMSHDGTRLPFATTIATAFWGAVTNITTDETGNVFVTGYGTTAASTPGVYPANPGAFDPTFIQKWNSTGLQPKLQLSATNVAFPDTPIGAVSAPQTITVQNAGAGPMELSIANQLNTYQLLPSADFPVTSNCGNTLAANASCTITASFAPASPSPECLAAPGCPLTTRSAVVTVQNNAPGGPQTISLFGNTGNGANISVSPNPVVFPAQPAGTNSANADVFVANNGDLSLTISSVAISGTNAADFKVSLVSAGGPACTTPVPTGGSSCQLEVTFTPAAGATGTRTANLVLTDGGIGSPQSIPLSGTVAGTGSLNVSPSSVTLNPTASGNGTTSSFNLSNPGSAAVQVTAISISGSNASEFSVSTGSCPGGVPFNVPAGGTCNLGVAFTPAPGAHGLRSASVSFGGPQITASPTVALSVDVVSNTDPAIRYFTVPNPMDFGSLGVGQSTGLQTHLIDISNAAPIPCGGGASSCGGPLNITSMTAGISDYVVSLSGSGGTCTLPPVTIASGNSCLYQVVFTPGAGGARNSTLNIASNDPQGTIPIALTGIGLTLPIVSATPSILNFGSAGIGVAGPPLTVTLENSGRGPLGPSTVTAPANFAVLANNCNQSVPAGGSCTITVTFTPPSTGPSSGTLLISNNAAFGGHQSVALVGAGGTGPSLLISPSALTFANQPAGTTSLAQTVTLTNTGTSAVTFPTGAFRITEQFGIVASTCGATLAPSATCSIAVTYTAVSDDPQGGTVFISDNAKGNPQPIYMNGSGQLNGSRASGTTLLSSANPVAAGQPVTFTAAVSSAFAGTLSGTVLFLDGTATIGASLVDGTAHASFTTSALGGGSHNITANYSGNQLYLPSNSSAVRQVVTGGTAPATTTTVLASSLNPSTAGASVTFTASVRSTTPGTITGSVTFNDGTTTLGSATVSAGQATFPTTALAQGSHSVTAVYGGDSNFATSTSAPLSQTVNASALATTATVLSSSPNPATSGQSVTLAATVSSSTAGTITGSVTFLDGTASLGVGTVSAGKATVSTSTLSSGSHSLTAAYGGDANYAASTSAAVTQTVNASADFSLALVPSTVTVKAGQTGMLTLNATPIGGASFTVNLACGALPAKTTCSFNPASITLDGKDVATTAVSIVTTANSAAWPWPAGRPKPLGPWTALAAVLAVLLGIAVRASFDPPRRVLWACTVLLVAIGLNSCNGGSGTAANGTPAGTYSVSVTATPVGGGTAHNATASIIVTQ